MNPSIQFKTTTLSFLIAFALACFGVSPTGRAVVPAPDGDYPGFNTAEGQDALFSLTTGIGNTANGAFALYTNRTGNGNTANGFEALFSNTTGIQNTANGVQALLNNTSGHDNTATGLNALRNNTVGIDNTADGRSALQNNTVGIANTANGRSALQSNTDGDHNTAIGFQALFHNTTGGFNTANGNVALYSNSTGGSNTADGFDALLNNTTGSNNTAIGVQALYSNTGSFNTALGLSAGLNLTTGDHNIDIGNKGVAAEANTIRIGTKETHTATFIAGISGKTASGGVAVYVNANGKLGTTVSSARFKEEIKPMDKASEAIHALKPVTFRYKQELDPEGIPQFGLVAEDVEKVNPDLVARDDQGKVYTVRYEAVNAMLLNEFLKEHRKNEEQEATIGKQQKQIEALTAGLQKVSDQLELSKRAPQIAVNDQ